MTNGKNEKYKKIENYIFLDSGTLDFLRKNEDSVLTPSILRKAYNLRLRVGHFLGVLLPCPICHKSQIKSRRVYSTAFDLCFNSLLYPSTKKILIDLDIDDPETQLKNEVLGLVRRKTEIITLGEVHGFHKEFYSRLRFHDFRIFDFGITQLFIVCFLIAIPPVIINIFLGQYLRFYSDLQFLNPSGFVSFLASLVFLLAFLSVYLFLLPLTISRLLLRFKYTHIAESICVLECLRILTELLQDEILSSPIKKKNLLTRMEILASTNLLIPASYPHRASRKSWVEQHFKAISAYIHDRQCWLLTPKENTLENLRNDFHGLTRIYISGLYGEFASEKILADKNKDILSQTPKILKVIGYFLPPFIIVFILINPSINPGLNEDLLSLFFMAWLLIGIDRYLNLGVVESVLDLARGLKDLS